MWLFLSRRIRTWLLLAVALPIGRAIIRRGAAYTGAHYPTTPLSPMLNHVDGLLGSFARRGGRGRRRKH